MSQVTLKSLREELDALRAHLSALTDKFAELEGAEITAPAAPAPAEPVAAAAEPVAPAPAPEPEEISEEILMALSAAVAAYLGKRAHIRTVRLLSSTAWAQQGRVNIQASHRLNVPHHHNRVR
ncbi:MAG TPA: hypothetical protein VGK29_16110 [Paludibaculum sp.]|jgi:methylmalonyl-CoA carboxyltransferase large subunit